MTRAEALAFIESIASDTAAFDILEKEVAQISAADLGEALLHCGVIPEQYGHDSSAEKLWAKYCDILLSRAFNLLDIRSEVIRIRGDSADIRGIAESYSIVADAKAFRLSRTAKNQKDFKIAALDDWRRGDTFACLVAPLYQYPNRSSQIYSQAKEKNVTLLSYVHLKFLLDYAEKSSLRPLWQRPGELSPTKDARRYWESIDDAIVAITGAGYEELRRYKQLGVRAIDEIASECIAYWEAVKRDYNQLSKEEAIARLIRAEKIEQKINTIRKQALRVRRVQNA